jgi:rhodanese-related sulfurtransferase
MVNMKTILILLLLLCLGNPSALHAEAKTNSVAAATVVSHVDAKAAARLVAENKVIILDVRTAEEFAGGHIAGATNINFSATDFATQAGRLDRTKTYLLHCASGGRSQRCLPQLQQLGFKEIIHLDGGLTAWKAAGNPIAKK